MKKQMSNFNFVLISAFFLGANLIFAADNISLTSSYLGDGLFKYEMTVHRDPFFLEEKNSIWLPVFTNLTEVVEHSPNWQFSNYTNSFALEYPLGYPDIPRPYTAYCIVKSTDTNYCTVQGRNTGAYITGSLLWIDDIFGNPYGSGNAAFYSRMEAIIPCSAEDADGSPPICVRHFEMIPDLSINHIILEEGLTKGLSFSWDTDCTVLIQASTNLNAWVDVEYALGSSPSTNWITTEPLENYGSFYKVLLVAHGHHPELLGGTAPSTRAMNQTSPAPPFNIQGGSEGKLALAIDTTPGTRYIASLKHNRTEALIEKIEIVADSESTTVSLDTFDLPLSASIEVLEVP